MKTRALVSAALLLLISQTTAAQLRVSQLFDDGMVLQREAVVPVWGWTTPGDEVIVTFDGRQSAAHADEDGAWRIELPAMAAGGPYEMTVESGADRVQMGGILIGDVWICSGQSNMEWTVARSNHAAREIAAASDAEIRHFKVPRSWTVAPVPTLAGGEWEVTSPETVGDFTAVGYYFARALREHVPVPIGLLNTSWGGSRIEPWMSAEVLDLDPSTLGDVEAAERKNHVPTILYNKMIHPLLPFPVKGVIWYQGESNANAEGAYEYRDLFKTMISQWRAEWEDQDLPFLWVQLANFRQPDEEPSESDWAVLRESQERALQLPNTGQAVIIDIGEADDIHPRNKQDVGYRLARAARKIAYGQDVVHSGPIYRSHEVRGNEIVISFDHVGRGLFTKGGADAPQEFAIAGSDGRFVWADARIEGDRVVVWSDEVREPVAVRYAWGDNPDGANLYNAEGLPASPFRTDRPE